MTDKTYNCISTLGDLLNDFAHVFDQYEFDMSDIKHILIIAGDLLFDRSIVTKGNNPEKQRVVFVECADSIYAKIAIEIANIYCKSVFQLGDFWSENILNWRGNKDGCTRGIQEAVLDYFSGRKIERVSFLEK